MELFPRVAYSLVLFVLTIILVIVSQPSFVYTKNGRLKHFGSSSQTGKEDVSMFSLGIITVISAITSFFLISFIDIFLS
jgi:hypothetical protein